MEPEEVTPDIPKSVLEYLERTYPDRCPDPGATEEAIRIYQGQIQVVRHLRAVYDQQNESS